MILEAAPLKQGTGKELRHLYDTVQQHLRALKAMDYEPFITSKARHKHHVRMAKTQPRFDRRTPLPETPSVREHPCSSL